MTKEEAFTNWYHGDNVVIAQNAWNAACDWQKAQDQKEIDWAREEIARLLAKNAELDEEAQELYCKQEGIRC